MNQMRERLPNRRASVTFNFSCGARRYCADQEVSPARRSAQQLDLIDECAPGRFPGNSKERSPSS